MQENEVLKPSSAADILATTRWTGRVPSGLIFTCKRLDVPELAGAIGGLPDVASLAVEPKSEKEARAAARRPETKQMFEQMNRIVVLGVHEPKLFHDAKDGLSVGELDPRDRSFLHNKIVELSDFTKEVGKEVLPLSKTAD